MSDARPTPKRPWRPPAVKTKAIATPAALLFCTGTGLMDCSTCGGRPGCCARNHGQCKHVCGC